MRNLYPEARCLVVATDADRPRVNRIGGWIETGLEYLENAIKLLDEL